METSAANRTRVLVVDDDRRFAELLAVLLSTSERVEVVAHAGDGEEAVALAESHRPDLVLMDLNMPVMGGIEATRRISALLPGVRVVVVTGSASSADVAQARAAGAAGYVTKDRVASDLLDVVLEETSPAESLARGMSNGTRRADHRIEPAVKPRMSWLLSPL